MSRIVLGYHGTTRTTAKAVLAGTPLQISRNRWDWLGDGVYFWEYGPFRAWEWARAEHVDQAAVLRARVVLDDPLDLTDLRGTRDLREAFDPFCAMLKAIGGALPAQKGKNHGLDRAVINFFAEKVKPATPVVRAAFIEGQRLWDGSGLWEKAHVQIAVRDLNLISGLALVEDPKDEHF